MSRWAIYHKPEETPIPVKDGFNWVAFFFPIVWSMVKLLPIPTVIGISFAFSFLIVPDAAPLAALFILVLMFFCGFKGNEWVCKNLEKNGYKFVTTLNADNKSQAYNESCRLVYAGDTLDSTEQSKLPDPDGTPITETHVNAGKNSSADSTDESRCCRQFQALRGRDAQVPG